MKENIIIKSRPIRNVITSRRGVEGAVYQADLNERRAMSNVSMEIKELTKIKSEHCQSEEVMTLSNATRVRPEDVKIIPDPANTKEARLAYDAEEFIEAEAEELRSIYMSMIHGNWC